MPSWIGRDDVAKATIHLQGNEDVLSLPAVGVVGTRDVSDVGLKVTEEYVGALAARGINIISGHARGVDMAAHRAAIAAGGVTTVVPARGLNGFRLHKDLQPAFDEGRVLIASTFPPEVGFARWMPIKRNRFIAELAHAMVVIESGEGGGTFHAAEAARALKRPLFVILYGSHIARAAGNRYFLESGARPLGRTVEGRPNLDELLETVAWQHASGNPPWEGDAREDDERMSQDDDRRVIEDYLPIEAISAEASREKSVRKGHISTLHLWWARRPLVACRAAVYGALVPMAQFRPVNGPEEKGVAGADLVIAAVGAGLRAFTRFARVEFANGEPVPAESFLAQVEAVVLEELLKKIFGVAGSGVATVDGPTRFYVLWRYAYKVAELEAGEAIVFTYGQNVELDGPQGLSNGRDALVEKKKGSYRLRDFTERGADEKLGQRTDADVPAPLVDALHRALWLLENQPRKLANFLDEANPNKDRLRMVAQALAGAALTGKSADAAAQFAATTPAEHAALIKLLANWRAVVENRQVAGSGSLFDGASHG
ncbi:MAG: DNA-processing protein DprA [Magnetococcales bacterium]|nr:DNA-processing protein DprA [Magnetococcales bacterium]